MNTKNLLSQFTTKEKIDNINAIIYECELQGVTDTNQIAYILATVKHETAGTYKPIDEFGKGAGRRYGGKMKMSGEKYSIPDKIYYGRGFVQLTWFENYERFGKLLAMDLLNNPELMLITNISAKVLVLGMRKGLFTGVELSKYFAASKIDFINARRIINGTDCAQKIAGYAERFAMLLR